MSDHKVTSAMISLELNLKRASRIVCMICVASLLVPASVIAQQQGLSIQQLKEQIKLMEEADKDKDITTEARVLNRKFLEDRRQQLAALLLSEITGLQRYQQSLSQSLTADENRKIEASILDLHRELEFLKKNIFTNGDSGIATERSNRPSGSRAISRESNSTPQPAGLNIRNAESPEFVNTSIKGTAALKSESSTLPTVCYPDAPNRLVNKVKAAAQLFLRGDDPRSQFGDIVFLATAHTVTVSQNRADLIRAIEIKQLQEQTKRTDKQIGASARAEGSTSAAEKPNFAEILGFAVENGSVQQIVSGTTLTLSTTPYALFAAFNGDSSGTYKEYGYLSRVGISANFLIQNEQNLLANASRRQLTSWSIRARLTPDRSTRSDDAQKIWDSISNQFAQPTLVITETLKQIFQNDPELEARRREVEEKFVGILAQPDVDNIRNDTNLAVNEKIDRIAEKMLCQVKADIVDQVDSGTFKLEQSTKNRLINVTLPAYASALKAKEEALRQFDERIDRLSYKPVLTFAFDQVRPETQRNYSILGALFQKKTGRSFSAIANTSVSFYKRPDHTLKQETVRDFAVALSFEGNAGRSPFLVERDDLGQITYSFTGRYQRFLENRFIANRKADIAVAQFKLNIPMFGGTSLPFSVSYANASELVKEDHVRANFGFSFDADKLLKVIRLTRLQGQGIR